MKLFALLLAGLTVATGGCGSSSEPRLTVAHVHAVFAGHDLDVIEPPVPIAGGITAFSHFPADGGREDLQVLVFRNSDQAASYRKADPGRFQAVEEIRQTHNVLLVVMKNATTAERAHAADAMDELVNEH